MDHLVVEELRRAFSGSVVLVTGDTGFKGSWLASCLLELGARVVGYALPPERSEDHFVQIGLAERIEHHDGDVRDLDALRAVFRRADPDFVFHLAAQPLVRRSYADPKTTFDTNVGGSVNLLECVRGASDRLRALVFVTSDKCYRNREWRWGYRENDELGGVDPYSSSKAAAELVFHAYSRSYFDERSGFGAASVRAGNVIGGGDFSPDRIVPDCIRSLRRQEPIVLRRPNATRPWQHVLEPVTGYLLLAARLGAEPTRHAGSYNFGPKPEDVRTVRELADRVVSGWGEGRCEELAETTGPHESGLLQLDCEKARQVLGWSPGWRFERAVDETVRWYRRVNDGHGARQITEEQLGGYLEGSA